MDKHTLSRCLPQLNEECVIYMVNQIDVAKKKVDAFSEGNTLFSRLFNIVSGKRDLDQSLLNETFEAQINAVTKFALNMQESINISYSGMIAIADKIDNLKEDIYNVAAFSEKILNSLVDFKSTVEARFNALESRVDFLYACKQIADHMTSWDIGYFEHLTFLETVCVILDDLKRKYFDLPESQFSTHLKIQLKDEFKKNIAKRLHLFPNQPSFEELFTYRKRSNQIVIDGLNFIGRDKDPLFTSYVSEIFNARIYFDNSYQSNITALLTPLDYVDILMMEILD